MAEDILEFIKERENAFINIIWNDEMGAYEIHARWNQVDVATTFQTNISNAVKNWLREKFEIECARLEKAGPENYTCDDGYYFPEWPNKMPPRGFKRVPNEGPWPDTKYVIDSDTDLSELPWELYEHKRSRSTKILAFQLMEDTSILFHGYRSKGLMGDYLVQMVGYVTLQDRKDFESQYAKSTTESIGG